MSARGPATFVELLSRRATATPDAVALEFAAGDGTEESVSYAGLHERACDVAALLGGQRAAGERALLMYPPGLGYVAAFLGCLYAGAIPVPVYPPAAGRGLERILAIARDARPRFVLTDAVCADIQHEFAGQSGLGAAAWLSTDAARGGAADGWCPPPRTPDDVAFLQYTSGSTGTPKGVIVRHGNLTHNSAAITRALGLGAQDRGVSWLPPYHDMGLIGGILQPLYAGFPCTLISPLTFLARPGCWLEAISAHQATITAAPDFGYLECVRRVRPDAAELLDLTSLRHALVGAEPIRPATLDAFAAAFAGAGFRRSSFYPCYGLAEATLLVTGASAGRGPAYLQVRRADLEQGRGVPLAGADGSAVTLVSSGRPRGAKVVVVDPRSRRPLPPGQIGEVWVSGQTVAAGYWDSPDDSAAVFAARLADGTGSFLRTGDLAFTRGGELYVTGRLKELIIVRGRNHYPHDIEQTSAAAHPLALPGRGAAFSVEGGDGERVILVQEVAPGCGPGDAPAVTAAVREAVAAEHGLALHDVVLVRRGHVPRTSSGKIRRDECRRRWLAGTLARLASPALPDSAERQVCAAAVTGPADVAGPATIAALAAQVLGIDSVPPDVPLIRCGFDSLRAVRLAAQIASSLGVDVPVDLILRGGTAASLAAAAGPRPAAATTARPPADGPGDERAASQAQTAMWLLDQIGAGAAYHIGCGFDLSGPVDPARLRDCLNALEREYEVLRSTFAMAADGILHVTIRPPSPVDLPFLDLTGDRDAAARCETEIGRLTTEPFDLAAGPLIRAMLVRLDDQRWRLGIAVHHIVADGWSLGILFGRLGELYEDGHAAAAVQPVPDYQQPADAGRDSPAVRRDDLAGVRPPGLIADYPATPGPSWRGGHVPVECAAELWARTREYAATAGATPLMVLLTALGAVLARWTGQQDMLISVPAAGRDRATRLAQVGLFVNTLPIRVNLSGRPTFRQALARVRESCLSAYGHAHIPYSSLTRTATDARDPLTRVMVALRDIPLEPWQAGGVRAEPFELPPPGAQFELSLHLAQRADGALAGHLVYAADMLAAEAVTGLVSGFTRLLAAALADDERPLARLPLLAPAERDHLIRELSGTRVPPLAAGLVHEEIEQRARAAPADLAVLAADRSLTYWELDTEAVGLAGSLAGRGAGPGTVVAVGLPRRADLLVAILAVLKTGAAYLPLDVGSPPARLAQQLAAARPVALVAAAGPAGDVMAKLARPGADAPGAAVIRLGGDPGRAQAGPGAGRRTRLPVPGDPADAANVIFTSGSTGHPKGVMTPHAALSNRMAWMQQAYPLTPGERVLHKTPLAFDVAGWELLWPLRVGATVVVAPPGAHTDPVQLARLIERHRVTTCHFVPSMLRVFLDEPEAAACRPSLRRVICSGEALAPELAARFHRLLPGVELHNLYGPAEAAIDVTAALVSPGSAGSGPRVPIGRPIDGARLYVLDAEGEPVPRNVPGELHIGGPVLADGYANAPARTAESFVPDPFAAGGRLYRTGDLARWRSDGQLEFLGRRDHQVKIRGHRIEPAEVEAALTAHPAVHACAVVVATDPFGQPRLIAYAAAGHNVVTQEELREFAASRLPAAMVPAAYVILAELPVGQTGKLDRAALPPPQPPAARALVPAATPVERELARIWCDVLGVERVSVRDDFFAVGGHSLLAARVVSRVRAEFGVRLTVGSLLTGEVTIEALADAVQAQQLAQADTQTLRAALERLEQISDTEASELLGKLGRDHAG